MKYTAEDFEKKNNKNAEDTSEKNGSEDKKSETDSKEALKVSHEDNLELSQLKFSERMKIKRERIKANMEGMSKNEKTKYLIMYFKWYGIVAIIALIAAVYTGYCVYQNNRPVALSYAIVNCHDLDKLNLDFEEDYKEAFGMTAPKYKIEHDTELFLGNPVAPDDMEQADYINVTKISTLCFNDYYDVIITDNLGARFAAAQGILFPLKQYFPEDVYNQIKDYEFISKDMNGEMVPVALDISNTEFAKNLNLGTDQVYIGFAGRNDKNYLNSIRMINYTLKLNLDIVTTGRSKLN